MDVRQQILCFFAGFNQSNFDPPITIIIASAQDLADFVYITCAAKTFDLADRDNGLSICRGHIDYLCAGFFLDLGPGVLEWEGSVED